MKTGDLVTLNSGSPLLTVVAIIPATADEPERAKVTWINVDGWGQSNEFPTVCLKLSPVGG